MHTPPAPASPRLPGLSQPKPGLSRRDALRTGVGVSIGLLAPAGLLSARPALPRTPDPAKLRFLCMNLWVGGRKGLDTEEASIARTLAVLREADCEVLALQEQSDLAETYAAELGMHCLVQDRSTAILSRHEILETTPHRWGARLDAPGLGPLWVFNVHFPAAPYQPYQLAGIDYHDGRLIATPAEAITEARLARGEPALRCLRELRPALATGAPVILAGDFNEPSHLDWTPEAAAAAVRTHAVDWPTTRLFSDAGLLDAFRTLWPDPLARPGQTWTPRPEAREVHDRIDLVLASPALRPTEAQVLGETGPMSDVALDPWPSDHRAVRVIFDRAGPQHADQPTSPAR
ncbi:MAG: endonuclease/exonuclease/phosphatase family protein [Phycisphaeraceae bacterium]|nr:endonuclease/exonuclease/phosphatase family protein [Phycisphaeraceae bacterium]MCW5762845.1 endonuclease/exonuclease/phosphatase family protein [Phycisphaeraceae bacterium]